MHAGSLWHHYLRKLTLGAGTGNDYFVFVVRDTTKKMRSILLRMKVKGRNWPGRLCAIPKWAIITKSNYWVSIIEDPRFVTDREAAALGGHGQIVQLLLQPDLRSRYNYFRAITYAASTDNLDLRGLVSKDADFNTFSEATTRAFWNHTLNFAPYHGNTKTIHFILNAGAQPRKTVW